MYNFTTYLENICLVFIMKMNQVLKVHSSYCLFFFKAGLSFILKSLIYSLQHSVTFRDIYLVSLSDLGGGGRCAGAGSDREATLIERTFQVTNSLTSY